MRKFRNLVLVAGMVAAILPAPAFAQGIGWTAETRTEVQGLIQSLPGCSAIPTGPLSCLALLNRIADLEEAALGVTGALTAAAYLNVVDQYGGTLDTALANFGTQRVSTASGGGTVPCVITDASASAACFP